MNGLLRVPTPWVPTALIKSMVLVAHVRQLYYYFRCLYMKLICVFYIVTEIEQRFNSMITLPNRYTCTNCTEADSRGVAGHDAGRARGRSRGRGFFPVLSKLIVEPHFTMYSNNNDTSVTSVMCRPDLESTVNHQQTTLPIFSRCFERGFKSIFFAVDWGTWRGTLNEKAKTKSGITLNHQLKSQ